MVMFQMGRSPLSNNAWQLPMDGLSLDFPWTPPRITNECMGPYASHFTLTNNSVPTGV